MPTTKNAAVFRMWLKGDFEEVKQKATMILNGVAFTLYADITEHTRVDTGRARAAWMISVYVAGDESPPPGLGKGNYPQPNQELFLGKLAVAPLSAKRIIYNNVSYIVWLELGTSHFAGDHMVQASIQRLISGSA